MNIYKCNTEAYRGYKISICQDMHAENPREWSNLGTFYTAHKRYCPEKEFDDYFDINEVFDGKIGVFKKSFLKEYIALPIYLYDHSGCSVSTCPFSCPWDSGFFGIVAVSVEDVCYEFEWERITAKRRKQIEAYLRGEVETYDQWLQGDVYGYTIETDKDEEGWEDLPEIDDSCWGFYGDDGVQQLLGEAKGSIDYALGLKAKKDVRIARCEAIWDAFGVD